MRLVEFAGPQDQKLIALSEYLSGRAGDTGAKKSIGIGAFINLANSMGVSITPQQLKDLAEQDPLKNVIVNITDDEVIFTGANSASADTMTVQQAEKTVEKMADRAMKSS